MHENKELDYQSDQAKCHEESIPAIEEDYEKVIISKKKSILNIVFRQGKVF